MVVLARIEMMKAIATVARSAATKYTAGITINAVASFDKTIVVSDIGSDFQNRTLRSLRSAYRQSSRYQVEYIDITAKKVAATVTRNTSVTVWLGTCSGIDIVSILPNSAARIMKPPITTGIIQI